MEITIFILSRDGTIGESSSNINNAQVNVNEVCDSS